jgi:hypothetical protein
LSTQGESFHNARLPKGIYTARNFAVIVHLAQ